jgi:magnesium chelatase accessory protein
MLQRRHLLVDGLRLSFLEHGTAAAGAPTLVLLHGLMGCADTFRPLLAELPDSVHAIALDFPGAGGSERRRDVSATLEASAAMTARLLEALGLSGVCLLGHSHGGAVAMRLAQTRPELVAKLVLLAPAHPYFQEAAPLIRFYLSLPGRLFAYSMPWYPRWMQMIGLRRMAGPQSWDTVERLKPYRENLRTRGTIAHLLRLLETWNEDMAELRGLLRRCVEQPVLMLWGDCDRAVPLRSAQELCTHLRDCDLRVMHGVGHRPAEERPLEVATAVTKYLGVRNDRPYKANSDASHDRRVSAMVPSFESGD